MRDKIIQIEVDNGGDILGLSETGNIYQLNHTNIDAPLWEHIIDSPLRDALGEFPIGGVNAAKATLEEMKQQA